MDYFGMQPQAPVKQTFGPQEQPYLPPKDNKKRTLIIVLCVCAAVFAVILGGWSHHIHSPAYRLQKGLLNLAREAEEMKNPLTEKAGMGAVRQMMAREGYSADSKLNVTFDTGSDLFGELTLGVDTKCDKDVRAKQMSASTALSLMNYEFGHVELYGDNENLCFSVPELFMEDMYIKNEGLKSQYYGSIWENWFGEIEEDGVLAERGQRLECSIDLFHDKWIFADEEGVFKAFLKEYDSELAECKRHMTVERAGSDLFRVSFDNTYFNELVRQVLYDYVDYSQIGREEAMVILSDFDVVSNGKDVSFLFELNGENRIESIRLEEPLSLRRGDLRISGDVYFLGEQSSIEKMQGKIEIERHGEEDAGDTEYTWQVVQSLEEDDYRLESNVRCSSSWDGEEYHAGVDIDFGCNGRKDSFETELSFHSPLGEAGLTAEGGLSHIQKGESFKLELDEVIISMDDEELLLIRGEYGVEPLARRVKQNVKPKRAFFEMDMDDMASWLDEMFDEYDYMYEYLLEGLW